MRNLTSVYNDELCYVMGVDGWCTGFERIGDELHVKLYGLHVCFGT